MANISAAAQPGITVAPRQSLQFVDPQTGNLSEPGIQFLQQQYQLINGMNRIIPAQCSGINLLTLTLLVIQPAVDKYQFGDTYAFSAANTSTGAMTAQVVTASATLANIKLFKANGAAQATTGDVVANLQYFATYVDSLDGGAGGLVLR